MLFPHPITGKHYRKYPERRQQRSYESMLTGF